MQLVVGIFRQTATNRSIKRTKPSVERESSDSQLLKRPQELGSRYCVRNEIAVDQSQLRYDRYAKVVSFWPHCHIVWVRALGGNRFDRMGLMVLIKVS